MRPEPTSQLSFDLRQATVKKSMWDDVYHLMWDDGRTVDGSPTYFDSYGAAVEWGEQLGVLKRRGDV